jgi:hypothetical protein
MKKIYHTMVEAKQNCEAIAFRGHRLLDQVRRQGSWAVAFNVQFSLRKIDDDTIFLNNAWRCTTAVQYCFNNST